MKFFGIATIIVVAFFGSVYFLTKDPVAPAGTLAAGNNVSMVDGVQIVEITAKGGYAPRKSLAKSGIPTVIRFNTGGTFDCSLAVRIPSLSISRNLPYSGNTDIDIGTPAAAKLQGTCGMGMYRFEIDFQS